MCCSEYENEEEAFYEALKNRLNKFSLEVSEDKTKILYFGRNAYYDSKFKRDSKLKAYKDRTFDFLGFTHYCSCSKNGSFRVKRKTSSKKFRASVKRVGEWLSNNRILPLTLLMEKLKQKSIGYYRYYGITDNIENLDKFKYVLRRLTFKWLNRRSQKRSYNGTSFDAMFKYLNIPKTKVYVNIFELKDDITYIL